MTAIAPTVTPDPPATPGDSSAVRSRLSRTGPIVAALVTAGAILRLWPRSALWLDEAQSVSFARMDLTAIPGALRQDGAPPLYYLVLHVWMRVFGDGDAAVRSLSVVLGLTAGLVLFVVVRRIAGTWAALASLAITMVAPFAVRYSAETRMYALVMLEVSLGILVIDRFLDRPTRRSAAALVLLSGGLLYTHYWSLYLVAATACVCFGLAWRRRRREAAVAGLCVAAGAVLWLPWLPTFWFQSHHTATPWAAKATVGAVFESAGLGIGGEGLVVPLFAVAMSILGLGALVGSGRREAEPRSAARGGINAKGLASALVMTLALAVTGAAVSDSAYATRYTAVVFPLAVALAGIGAVRLRSRALTVGALAAVLGLGTAMSIGEIRTDRTRAGALATALAAASPDDFVVYCPDQLGPATSRLLDRRTDAPAQVAYPPGSAPQLVDWVDYAARMRAADPAPFVAAVDRRAAAATVWLVVSLTYPPTQPACGDLLAELLATRADHERLIDDDPSVADHGALWRFGPG